MKLNYLFGAVAACGLIAGAAYAQPSSMGAPSDTTSGSSTGMSAPSTSGSGMSGSMSSSPSSSSGPSSAMSSGMSSGATPSDQAMPDAATSSDTGANGMNAASATASGQNASVTTTTTTNGPVPDTAENRQRYGGPNSHAGRRTAAKGN